MSGASETENACVGEQKRRRGGGRRERDRACHGWLAWVAGWVWVGFLWLWAVVVIQRVKHDRYEPFKFYFAFFRLSKLFGVNKRQVLSQVVPEVFKNCHSSLQIRKLMNMAFLFSHPDKTFIKIGHGSIFFCSDLFLGCGLLMCPMPFDHIK